MHEPSSAEPRGVVPPADRASGQPPSYKFDKVVIAVHGIGEQRHGDTVRAVSRRFGNLEEPPLPIQPLGYFDMESDGKVLVSELQGANKYRTVGLAEIFWADIPQALLSQQNRLEEIKAWGDTVVSRARETYQVARHNAPAQVSKLSPGDFALAKHVLDQIIDTLGVLENLLLVLDKLDVFKFDIGPLLRGYLGDVQVFTEFRRDRNKILARFHDHMNQIVADFGTSPCEIYIVAHSEGSVVSFLALLQALSSADISAPDGSGSISTGWVQHVRGFMTIGSPIDKHLVLWPRLWEGLNLRSRRLEDGSVVFEGGGSSRTLRAPIAWRNYYDHGDPVGFKLDAARRFLKQQECAAFSFEAEHDIGFSRYYFPGKAHVDYWTDADVFGHFIHEVVSPTVATPPSSVHGAPAAVQPKIPTSKRSASLVAYALPYLVLLLVHMAAVFAVLKGLTAFVSPGGWGLVSARHLALKVSVLGLLLLGTTIAARLPRLVKVDGLDYRHLRWYPLALLALLLAAAPTLLTLPFALCAPQLYPAVLTPASYFDRLTAALAQPAIADRMWILVALATVVTLSGWLAPRRPHWGSKLLVGTGTALVAALVIWRLLGAPAVDHACSPVVAREASTAAGIASSAEVDEPGDDAPIWPLLLSGAAFVFLWRLGVLLFDLSFVWHRYVRLEAGVDALDSWDRHRRAHTLR